MRRMLNSILVVILFILAFSARPAEAQQGAPFYVVQQGDTLSVLARTFGTTVEALARANAISDPSLLYPGMELIIPNYKGFQGELAVAQVSFGESLLSLASRFGLSVDQSARLNRVVNPERVYASQPWVVIKQGEEPSPGIGARLSLPRAGETRLLFAVREGINPWEIGRAERDSLSKWRLPGDLFLVSSGEPLAHAFPHPVEEVEMSPQPAVQGKTTLVRLNAAADLVVQGSLGEHELHFFPNGEGEHVALQGIHAMAEPGLYDLNLEILYEDEGVGAFRYRQPVNVTSGDYGFENINGVPAETIDPEVTEPEEAFVAELLSPVTTDRHWSGSFVFPSTYYTESFLSIFGTRRSYNWGAFQYYHTGMDFYANTGMPIQASAAGRVVFAGSLKVRGGVTYIDHGWGVYSGYFHQSEIFVTEGEQVEQGQVIGEVGGTGRSTGPHMHWEIWVGGVPVDPIDWVEGSFP
jgi:murein DD-endopeptidase MepM/ murein hydrolase activator NlpD